MDRTCRLFLLLVGIVFAGPASAMDLGAAEKAVQERSERAALRYFIENSHPNSGLARDMAENFSETPKSNRMASMASTGFGLAVLANAASRGWIDRAKTQIAVARTLRFARDRVPRRKGWFQHFVDWETGRPFPGSEFSTIDSALFLAGALYAGATFPESESSRLAAQIYEETDFIDAMSDGGALPDKRTLSMAWTANGGYTSAQWDMYAEQSILLLLGLGHPTRPLPASAWTAWARSRASVANDQSLMGQDQALFTHQYSQAFVDFRAFDDGCPNYFANSALAARWHRSFTQTDPSRRSLREGFWGFSAGQSPKGYEVWNPLNYNGLVCIGCAAASAMHEPALVLGDMARWASGPWAARIWGRYGFSDSLDLDRDWISSQVLGITVGPAYLSLANVRPETSVWRAFMALRFMRAALARAQAAGPESCRSRTTALGA